MILTKSAEDEHALPQKLNHFKKGKGSIKGDKDEKIGNIPESIYLPRKHFPTKQKYQQESRERERQ